MISANEKTTRWQKMETQQFRPIRKYSFYNNNYQNIRTFLTLIPAKNKSSYGYEKTRLSQFGISCTLNVAKVLPPIILKKQTDLLSKTLLNSDCF